MMSRRMLFVVNSTKYFVSHRLHLARAAREAGWDVHVAALDGPEAEMITAEGFPFYPVPIRRGTLAPWTELGAVMALVSAFRDVRPEVVHNITLKPVLYGTMAARVAGVPAVVNTIAGLGYLYSDDGLRPRVLRTVFRAVARVAFAHPRCRFIFQNAEDLEAFVSDGLTTRSAADLIRGSGVDMSVFVPKDAAAGVPIVVLPSRLLWDKGVGEFVAAARTLRSSGTAARFVLVGEPDPGNPRAVPVEQIHAWREEGTVEWWGYRSDMPAVLASSDIVTLPSAYREGVPKVLIEAASCGRALVATDMPGCRDIVRHEQNGFVVPPRDPAALARALGRLIEDRSLRAAYGASGRELVRREFAIEHVVERTLSVYERVVSTAAPEFGGMTA
jgi:glycosyltransferase involved in cell wall biosynthesis